MIKVNTWTSYSEKIGDEYYFVIEDGTTIIKHVFLHTCDNSLKKFKVANSRNKLPEIVKINSVELLLKDVIY